MACTCIHFAEFEQTCDSHLVGAINKSSHGWSRITWRGCQENPRNAQVSDRPHNAQVPRKPRPSLTFFLVFLVSLVPHSLSSVSLPHPAFSRCLSSFSLASRSVNSFTTTAKSNSDCIMELSICFIKKRIWSTRAHMCSCLKKVDCFIDAKTQQMFLGMLCSLPSN